MKIITRKEAVTNGLSRFYTGKPCRHGHDSERFTSNGVCVECSAINSAAYRKEISRLLKQAREMGACQ
ncbi:hypothetical protein LHV16_17615 [Providencia rettgeri]|uniref:hypothetical protein n=1 Tax=Providencia rettgeri TaxID=587 RepID=UPI001B39A4EC|nr:hypothetical protein [Providencia rettgeri]EJD6367785.1 hypothetical protein [Providencia rettgeri]EJD6372012.1 hypothetical protein [Providencia rettgeri]ELR5159521.1 hypothetical protein [Providencia rettgeri]ELR5195423.1 hypothetical protein [Providencia rettgeri]MBQ0361488.1 hypothetical protein [Providencia rettgeri]